MTRRCPPADISLHGPPSQERHLISPQDHSEVRMSASRWLSWTPEDAIIGKRLDREPPKPSKIRSEGFGGPVSGSFPIIKCPAGSSSEGSTVQTAATRSHIFQWIRARCTRRKDFWGSEKFLWVDYAGWQQQQTGPVVTREQFAEGLAELFEREMDGWRGIALASDVAPSERYIV